MATLTRRHYDIMAETLGRSINYLVELGMSQEQIDRYVSIYIGELRRHTTENFDKQRFRDYTRSYIK